MKIVVYEHFTSGALQGRKLPAELAVEGDAMLQAIISDMLMNTPFTPRVIRDNRLPPIANIENLIAGDAQQYQQIWQQCLDGDQFFLLIAPETGAVLQNLAAAVLKAGKTLLGASPPAINICSSKLKCSQWLQQFQLPVVASQSAADWLSQPAFNAAVVCKPDDGAGCVDTCYFADTMAARAYLQQLSAAQRHRQIVQPFIRGEAMSLSLFIDKQPEILSLNQQIIAVDQQFSYRGSNVNVPFPATFTETQAQAMLNQLLTALPGLWGFAGIDIIVGDHQTWIVDINPRLTTSFNQLGKTGISPAKRLYQTLPAIKDGRAYG